MWQCLYYFSYPNSIGLTFLEMFNYYFLTPNIPNLFAFNSDAGHKEYITTY
jgi:hypothetical protein